MKDLHIHTKYSDGEYDEYTIIEKVKNAGVKEFSVCDHDTLDGSKKVFDLVSKDRSLIYHLGVELSCRLKAFGGIDIHLLVRDYNYNDEKLKELVDKVSSFRIIKIERMVELVRDVYGIELSAKEVEEEAKKTKSFGKPHIYSLLQRHGNFDREEFYKNMRNLKSEDLKLDAVEVLQMMKNREGYATLAHPIEIMDEYNFDYEGIEKIVSYLVNEGLDGLETRHSKHTEKDFREFSKIAKKYNLIETEGSDYHGPNVKPNVKIGVCIKE